MPEISDALNPLIILCGGPLTTIADAYLKDHSIGDKVVVLFANDDGEPGGPYYDFRSYNGWADGWAAWIVPE